MGSLALADFKGRHEGETVIVCGCGPSLNELPQPERWLTIGVNDVGRLFDPSYLVVLNPRTQFKGDRYSHVEQSRAQALFTQLDPGPVRPPVVRFKLGRYGGTDDGAGQVLHYTQNSPYVAVCLAALMGARRIGLIGVDLTEHHFFAATGRHSLAGRLREIDAQYTRLAQALRERGVALVNLSTVSRLSGLPRARIAADGAWATQAAGVVAMPTRRVAPTGTLPMKVAIEKRVHGVDAELLDALAATVASLGHTVSREPQRTAADPQVLSIVWNGSRHRGRGPMLYCEHGWLPRADYQISPRGINADSHAAPFVWDGQALSDAHSAALDARLGALRQSSSAGGPATVDLPPHFLLVPLQIEADTNIVRHAPAHLRTMQALVDHVARANPPWPVVFKQHPTDAGRGNRHLGLKMRRPQDRLWPQSRGNIHAMLASGACRGILTLNSNVAHDGLLWGVPAIVLARNVWPTSGERTPFLTAIPADWSALQLSVTEPEAIACRRAYAHHLIQHQWRLADARDPERVAALLATAQRRPAPVAAPVVPTVQATGGRKVVPLVRTAAPVINVVAEDCGWLFECWKRALVQAGHTSCQVVATQRPMPQARAWVYIRAKEAAGAPDFSRTVVQLHDLYDDGRYAVNGERAAVAQCAAISLTHRQQELLLQASGIDLSRRQWILQPVGWSGTAAVPATRDDTLPSIAWVGRPAMQGGVDLSGLDAFVESARVLRGRARLVMVGERLERAVQRLRAAGVDARAQSLRACPMDRASEWLAYFDAVAVSTATDAGPWPLFDALQAGVPVVAPRIGWAEALLGDGVCGTLVDQVADMGPALLACVERRAHWRQSAALLRERVAPFSLQAWAHANLQLAADLAGGQARQVA
jgi:glycosyltransferase involved in cell wall biosynthesis